MTLQSNLKELRQEWLIAIAVIISFAFIIINVDPDLGSVYTAISVVSIAMVLYFVITKQTPKYSIYILRRGQNWVTTATYAFGGFIAFTFVSQFVVQNLALVPQSVFEILQATSPVLSNVSQIQFVTFGIIIPFIETFVFFVLGLDILLLVTNTSNPDLKSLNFWIINIVITSLFVLFHFNAKLVTGSSSLLQPALIITAVFASLSMVLVVVRKQWFEALMLHIGINAWTMYQLLYA